MDYKSPQAFRTISEVADALDLPQHVLRFWETKFRQIKPTKRGGGRRYYRPEDIDLLRGIKKLLYNDGYTIKGLQKIFKEKGINFVANNWRSDDEINTGYDNDTGRPINPAPKAAHISPSPPQDTPFFQNKSQQKQSYSSRQAQQENYHRPLQTDNNISFNRGNDYDANSTNHKQRDLPSQDRISLNQKNNQNRDEVIKEEVKSYPFKQDYFSRDEIFKLDEMKQNNNNNNNQKNNDVFDEQRAQADYVRHEHHIPTDNLYQGDNYQSQTRASVKGGLSRNQIRILQASLFELGEIKRILES